MIDNEAIINAKYRNARLEENFLFREEDYEWELGKEVINKAVLDSEKYFKAPVQVMTCYGIPIRINMENPDKIELWKKVK